MISHCSISGEGFKGRCDGIDKPNETSGSVPSILVFSIYHGESAHKLITARRVFRPFDEREAAGSPHTMTVMALEYSAVASTNLLE